MVNFYRSLSEKDRRRYAAVEAGKLGHGGIAYIARLFDCDPDTIRRGLADVGELPQDAVFSERLAVSPARQQWLPPSGPSSATVPPPTLPGRFGNAWVAPALIPVMVSARGRMCG